MEIIFLDFVDGELLFFATEFFPFALRFGYVLFGKLRNGVILVPEVEELLVDGFLFLHRFGIPHPFVIFREHYFRYEMRAGVFYSDVSATRIAFCRSGIFA